MLRMNALCVRSVWSDERRAGDELRDIGRQGIRATAGIPHCTGSAPSERQKFSELASVRLL